MKSSSSVWHYVVNVKSMVKISSIFVAFLENMNFPIQNLQRALILETSNRTGTIFGHVLQ